MSALVLPGALPRHGADAAIGDAPATLARYRTFHTLDALRGVAAIVVLMFHAAFFYGIAPPADGYVAVDLFFMMSGFIIAYRYEQDFAHGMGVGSFLAIRLIRLYPLFLLGTLLGALPAFIAVAAGHGDSMHWGQTESLPLALLFLPSRLAMQRSTGLYPLNYVSWSLMLEILVNLAYAATYRVCSTRRLVLLVAASFVGLCVAAAAYGSLNVGHDWKNWLGGLPRILFGFGLGILIFRRHAARPFAVRVPWWLLVAIVPAVLFFDPRVLPVVWIKPVWDVALVTLFVPAIVIAAIGSEPPKAAHGACALAGIFSYALYSLHAPVVGLFLRGEERLHLDLDVASPARAIALTVLLAVVCVVAHVAYDKPLRSRLMRLRAARRIGMASGSSAAVPGRG